MTRLTFDIPATGPSVEKIVGLHNSLKGNQIVEAREYDGTCYVKYDYYDNDNHNHNETTIGDFATVTGRDLILHIRSSEDIRQMPIWLFINRTNSPIKQYIDDSDYLFDISIDYTLSLNQYSSSISAQKASKFLTVYRTFKQEPHNIAKQFLTLGAIVRCFFGEFNDTINGQELIQSISDIIHRISFIHDIDVILNRVNTNKYIPMKSPCLKRYKTLNKNYHTFTCGFPIVKANNFRVFAKIPELQIMHLISTYKTDELE